MRTNTRLLTATLIAVFLTSGLASVANAVPPDTTPPGPVTDLGATAGSGTVTLTWTDPTDADWDHTEVRWERGSSPPPTLMSGTGVAYSTTGQVTASDLVDRSNYSFAVFPVDASGNVGPARSVVVRGSSMQVLADSSTVIRGEMTRLLGELDAVDTSTGQGGEPVQIEAEARIGGTWRVLGSTTTATDGTWSWAVHPAANTAYRAAFAGDGDLLGTSSEDTTVWVAPRITVTIHRTLSGEMFHYAFAGVIAPNLGGQRVQLERRINLRWTVVRSSHLSTASRVRFHADLRRGGGWQRFRIVKPSDSDHVIGYSTQLVVRPR